MFRLQGADTNASEMNILEEDEDDVEEIIRIDTSVPEQLANADSTAIVLSDSILLGADPADPNTRVYAKSGAMLGKVRVVLDIAKEEDNIKKVVLAMGINKIYSSSSSQTIHPHCKQSTVGCQDSLPRCRHLLQQYHPQNWTKTSHCVQ